MRSYVARFPAVAVMLLLVPLAGCGRADQTTELPSSRSAVAASDPANVSPSAGAVASTELPQGDEPVELDPADFTTQIDNPYWPMAPGTRWTYRETDEKGNRQEVVVTVTNEIRKIANGIAARVVRDTVTQDDQLVEDTKDWYAQDAQGNIWYLGEDTAEFENGRITTRAGSFEAGVGGALPGIIMPADPQPGMRYRQEYDKGDAQDNGEVLSTAELAEVPYGQFRDALLTKDTITIEPDVLEYKLYAQDVGPVLILGVSGGGGREELISMDQVGDRAGTGPLGSPHP